MKTLLAALLAATALLPLPAALSASQAMAIGTAGYTAMLCVMALEEQGVKPSDGDILVTGIYGVLLGVQIYTWIWWQKRGTKKSTEVEQSTYGRPLVKKA